MNQEGLENVVAACAPFHNPLQSVTTSESQSYTILRPTGTRVIANSSCAIHDAQRSAEPSSLSCLLQWQKRSIVLQYVMSQPPEACSMNQLPLPTCFGLLQQFLPVQDFMPRAKVA